MHKKQSGENIPDIFLYTELTSNEMRTIFCALSHAVTLRQLFHVRSNKKWNEKQEERK